MSKDKRKWSSDQQGCHTTPDTCDIKRVHNMPSVLYEPGVLFNNTLNNTLNKVSTFSCNEPIGFKDVMETLRRDQQIMVNQKIIYLHTAFKQALETHFKVLKDNAVAAALYHGSSGIGKSQLAIATAYYLAMAYGRSCLLVFEHRPANRDKKYAEAVEHFIHEKCLIIDQVNTIRMTPSWLLKKDVCPVTVFTSGHYMPPPAWTGVAFIHARIIDLKLQTCDIVELIKRNALWQPLLPLAEDIGKASQCYGLLKMSMISIVSDPECDIVSAIYRLNTLTDSKLDIAMFLWYVWEDFYQNNTSPEDIDSVKLEDFLIRKEEVLYLAELLTRVEMDGADPMLNILTWLTLVPLFPPAAPEATTGYVEYEANKCAFSFANVAVLRKLLHKPYSMKTAMDVFASAYKLLGMDTINQYIRGGLFEKYTQYYAIVNNTGFRYITSTTIEEVPVNTIDVAVSVDDLVAHVICTGRCREPHGPKMTWLYLNKDKCKPLKGYDFAFIEVNHGKKHKVTKLQLFQATVSVSCKNEAVQRRNMQEVAEQVCWNLKDYIEDGKAKEVVQLVLFVPGDKDARSYFLDTNQQWKVNVAHVSSSTFKL